MAVEQYNLINGDWLGLGYIINDLATRVVGQLVSPGSSPSFVGATLTGKLTAGATTLDSLVVDSPTLVVNAAGYTDKVGIGTASPGETLEVAGNIAVTGIAGDDVYIFNNAGSGIRIRSDSLTTQWWAGDDGPAYFGTVSNDDLHIQTNNNTRITILSGAGSGYVGIGVTDPDAKLEVVGTLHVSDAATFDSTLGAGAITASGLVTINNQLDVRDDSYPVVNIQRDLSFDPLGSMFGGARLKITVPTTPIANLGIGFYFEVPDSAENSTFAGVFGARLSTITNGLEIGDFIFNPAWHGLDPGAVASGTHFRIRAISQTQSEVRVPYRLKIGADSAPAMELDVAGQAQFLSTTDPQLRLIHTATDDECDFHVDADGHLNIDPTGDRIDLFGQNTVADAAAGKALYIHRNAAAELDTYMKFWIADDTQPYIESSTSLINFNTTSLTTTANFIGPVQVSVSTGVQLTAAAGVLTMAGLGAGQDEDLTWDFDTVLNRVGVGSGSGVTGIDFSMGATFSDDVVLPKTSGKGIKIEPAAPTFGWRDLLGEISVKTVGANDPDYSDYAATGIYRYQFKNTAVTEVFDDFHIPHDYVAGTEVYVHIHWSQTTIDSGGALGVPGVAKWYFDANYSKGHDRGAFPAAVTTVSVTQTASGTIRQHMIAEVQLTTNGQIGGQDLEPDGVATVRTYRDSADGADTLDQRPWVHHVDLHYQSTNIATKAKAPDFYV